MFMIRMFCLGLFLTPVLMGQEGKKGLQVDFLASYYDQDGEHSPVTGGIGSEELQSTSPVFVFKYQMQSGWDLAATLGADNISSASIDAMDDNLSSASKVDTRVFTSLSATRRMGGSDWTFNLGFSKEYDYTSVNGGLGWSKNFNQNNTTLSAFVHHYSDTIDLYDIDGVNQGGDDRTTTDFSLNFTQVLSAKTVAGVELYLSNQSGFLSSPFQEVILDTGEHVAERLPDSRRRTALRFSLNHAFSKKVILRSYYRIYDDDFGVQAHSVELEPHFRLPYGKKTWLYPIFRYHTQTGSDYYGKPQTFSATDPYYTADNDISEFDSMKYGLGTSYALNGRYFDRVDLRATYYDREDGLNAFALSFGFGWSF